MALTPNDKTMDGPHLKEEKQDAEIDEMAMEIIEKNKTKMALLRKIAVAPDIKPLVAQTPSPEIQSADSTSVYGKFGWTEFAKTCFPYIMRSTEEYVAMRMLEMKIFPNYPSKEIAMCIDVDRFKLTKAEAGLLNEINLQHADSLFGNASFSEHEDLIHLQDAISIYEFLEFCYENLRQGGATGKERCGFVRLDGMFIPYVCWNFRRYAPLFYFDGEVKYLKEKSVEVGGWRLAYLKFLCKVHNTFKPIQDQKSILAVDLEIVMQCFVPGTPFEEMWPINNKIEALLGQSYSSMTTNNENRKNNRISPQRETGRNVKTPDVTNLLMQPQYTPQLVCPNVNLFDPTTLTSPRVRFKVTPKKQYDRRAPYEVQRLLMQNGCSNQTVVSAANQTFTVPRSSHTNVANGSRFDQAIVGVANQTLTVPQSGLTNVSNGRNSDQAIVGVANQTLTVPQSGLTNVANGSRFDQAIVGVANQTLTVPQSGFTNVSNGRNSDQAIVAVANQTLTVPQSGLTNVANGSRFDQAIVRVAKQTFTVPQSVPENLTNRSKTPLTTCLPPYIINQMQPVRVPNSENYRTCFLLQIPNFNVNNNTAYTLATYRVEDVTLKHTISISPDDCFVLVTLSEVLSALVKVPYAILKRALNYLRFYVFLPNKAQANLLRSVGLLPSTGLVSAVDLKFYLSTLRMVCQSICNLALS